MAVAETLQLALVAQGFVYTLPSSGPPYRLPSDRLAPP